MATRAVTVDLGDETELAERHLRTGRYTSMSDVVQAGLQALDRETAGFDAVLKVKIEEALADPRPSIPIDEAFRRLRALATARRGVDGA